MILHVGVNVENVALCWGIVETGLLTWKQVFYPETQFCNLSQFWLLTELSIYNTLLNILFHALHVVLLYRNCVFV